MPRVRQHDDGEHAAILQARTPDQVFVPLHDDNKLTSIDFQYVTVSLIAINVLVYVIGLADQTSSASLSFAMIPSELHQVSYWGGPVIGPFAEYAVPEQYTLLTYMFLHGGFWHLTGHRLCIWPVPFAAGLSA